MLVRARGREIDSTHDGGMQSHIVKSLGLERLLYGAISLIYGLEGSIGRF